MRKIFKIAGIIILAVIFFIGATFSAGLVGLYFLFHPPISKEKTLKDFFDFEICQVKNLKLDYWQGCTKYSYNFRFEVADEKRMDDFLRDKFVCLNHVPRNKESFFGERNFVGWWKPDRNADFEFYEIKRKFVAGFEDKVCSGYLYFDRGKKLVYAEFVFF